MRPDQAASFLCGAGLAPFYLAVAGTILGAAIGLMIGVTVALMEKAEAPSTQLTIEK